MHFKSKIKKLFIQFETKYLPNFQNCIKIYGLSFGCFYNEENELNLVDLRYNYGAGKKQP